MSSPPDIDPYLELGVSKDATLAEIRASHRKRVLKCHPDKILDDAQRDAANDEFQRVQFAYELLSDQDRRYRYDEKVRLAAAVEQRRDLLERKRAEASARGAASSREMRDGHIVEERVPFESYFEETRLYEEPLSFSRKADGFVKRPKAKEEKKKTTRTPLSSERAAKDFRDSTKASHSERQRRRDKERRGQQSDKYESFGPFVVDSGSSSDSSDSEDYRPKSTRRPRETRTRHTEPSRRRERDLYDDDNFSDRYEGKLNRAEEHIERSKYDPHRSRTSPHRSRGYDSPEPEPYTSRRSGRSSRANQNRSSSRNNSYEDLEPRYERPKMPTSNTMPGTKSSLRPTLFRGSRSSSTAFVRSKRGESSSRDDILNKMAQETVPPRSSKSREKYDSGYSSPSTPELPPKSTTPKVTARYNIIEPTSAKSSRHRTGSAESERPRERERTPRMSPPKRSSTYQPSTKEASPRIEIRSVRPSRPYGDVEFSPYIREEDVKYTREIRPSDANISPNRNYYYTEHIRPRRAAAGTA